MWNGHSPGLLRVLPRMYFPPVLVPSQPQVARRPHAGIVCIQRKKREYQQSGNTVQEMGKQLGVHKSEYWR